MQNRKRAVSIVADHREKPSRIPALLSENPCVELRIEELSIGDYVVDNRVVFERKTASDFARSLIDTRLFRQASRLRRSPLRSANILEADPLEADLGVGREALAGALVSLTIIFDIPVLRSRGQAETAKLLTFAAKQLAGIARQHRQWKPRPTKSVQRKRLRVLEALPGVGPDKAGKLLVTFWNTRGLLSSHGGRASYDPGLRLENGQENPRPRRLATLR